MAGFIIVSAVLFAVMLFSGDYEIETKEQKTLVKMEEAAYIHGIFSLLAAAIIAPILSIAFLYFAKHNTECIIWSAGLFGCLSFAISGAFMMSKKWPFPGAIGATIMAMGLCFAICFLLFGKDFVRFTALFMQTVLHVAEVHPASVLISFISGLIAALWTLACKAALLGGFVFNFQEDAGLKSEITQATQAGLQALWMGTLFLWPLYFYWGALVCLNTAFTANAGLFARWYFDKDQGSPAASSLWIAWTTSFGSICYGSFVVALVPWFCRCFWCFF